MTLWPNQYFVCDRHHQALIDTANGYNQTVRSTKLRPGHSYCGACMAEHVLT